MRLANGSGVGCDKCRLECRHDFTYYALEFRQVAVNDNYRPPLENILTTQPILELDFCPMCYGALAETVVAVNSKLISPTRRARVNLTCELTGAALVGSFTYYYVTITRVEVKFVNGKPLVRPIERLLEFVLCAAKYPEFSTLLQSKPVENPWTTQS